MRIEELSIPGAYAIHGTQSTDQRGAFSRLVDFAAVRQATSLATTGYLAVAYNSSAGTVRGLHVQVEPAPETKLIWCSAGSAYDVLVDVRADQPTYGHWIAVELSARTAVTILIPPGVAHGYQTLLDDTALTYLIDGRREPACERAINWQDPELAISWPTTVSEISTRDATAPTLSSFVA